MSYEPFNDASGGMMWLSSKAKSEEQLKAEVPAGFTEKNMQYAIYKCAHTFKLFVSVVLLILVVYMMWMVATYIADKVFGIKLAGKLALKKEGLQYLGASTNVTLGHLENNKDSLAEQALAQQYAHHDEVQAPVAKQAFTEHAVMSPEEKEMKAIKKTIA